MKQTLTAKLKLKTTPEQFAALRTTQLAYRDARYTLHADLVGARNIVMRTLLVRQDWARTGQLSGAPGSSSEEPDVSIAEAKAARLRRYAELRWISDTSPCDLSGGI